MPDEVTYELPDDVHVLVAKPNYTNLFSSEAHTNHIECVSEWRKWVKENRKQSKTREEATDRDNAVEEAERILARKSGTDTDEPVG